MNRTSLFENNEIRRLFAAFAALAAFFVIFTVLFSAISIHQLESQLVLRESAVAGRLISSHTANTDEVIHAFVTSDKAEDAAVGAEALERAGYSSKTADVLLPFLQDDKAWFDIILPVAACLIFLIFGTLCALFLKKIYRRIDEAGKQAILVSRGNYGVRLDEDAEGAFARMNHAFNEMSAGVNTGFEKLGRERIFLKNLISDISHQLKTPLSALKMYNEILLQEQLSETALDFAKKSGEQLERMEWLILGLLKMARVEAGALDMDLQRYDLKTIVEEALNDFSFAAKEKNIEIRLRSDGSPELLCDAGWLKEALGNVIKNCIEYTPPGGGITAMVEQTPVMMSVRIRDTGAGIHPDDLPYVFRRFYRGRGSRSTGSGIGLSLAKSIVAQMGGTLGAGGEYGRCAEFTFSFLKNVI